MGGGEWFLVFFFFSLLPLILHLLDNFVSVFVCLFYLELLLFSLFSSLSYGGWRKTWVSGYLMPTCPPGFTFNESWFLKIYIWESFYLNAKLKSCIITITSSWKVFAVFSTLYSHKLWPNLVSRLSSCLPHYFLAPCIWWNFPGFWAGFVSSCYVFEY